MPYSDESPRGSAAFNASPSYITQQPVASQHMRRRSSTSQSLQPISSAIAPFPSTASPGSRSPGLTYSASSNGASTTNLGLPFVSHLVYDEKTGEISLPASPTRPSLNSYGRSQSYTGSEKENLSSKTRSDLRSKGGLPPYRFPSHKGKLMNGGPTSPTRKGRAFQLPRPWISAISLAGVTLSFCFLMTYLIPSSSTLQTAKMLSRLHPMTSSCDPYATAGELHVNLHDPDSNQWIPKNKNCQPPQFLSHLRADSHLSHSESAHAKHGHDFTWLHNKTSLIIGDAISREHVENFCLLMGETSEIVRAGHRFYVGTVGKERGGAKSGHATGRKNRLAERASGNPTNTPPRVVKDASAPRVCYLPKYDFLLVSVFHFGLDQEDYWRESGMPQYTSPGMFEHRLSDMFQPLLTAIRASGRPSAPDLVELSSASWDLARWAQQDLISGDKPEDSLQRDRIIWYKFRVGNVLEKVRKAFPNAKTRMFRTMHFPLDPAAEFHHFMDKISPRRRNAEKEITPNYFPHNRIEQLDTAVKSLIQSTSTAEDGAAPHGEYRLNDWGRLIKGHEAHQKDRLHGEPLPGAYLWSDVMLYELWRGVKLAQA